MDTPKEDGGATSRAERHVVVPVELLSDLWRYGNLNRIDGVLYGKSHADRLKEADDILCKALSAAPPVQMEAVAWRVGVPNNEYATLHADIAEISRNNGYEVTPLYASPVPSPERDDIIEMCAQWHDARAICLRAVAAKWGDHRSTKRVALEALAVADVHEDSASSIRSLKSQPAQSGEGK